MRCSKVPKAPVKYLKVINELGLCSPVFYYCCSRRLMGEGDEERTGFTSIRIFLKCPQSWCLLSEFPRLNEEHGKWEPKQLISCAFLWLEIVQWDVEGAFNLFCWCWFTYSSLWGLHYKLSDFLDCFFDVCSTPQPNCRQASSCIMLFYGAQCTSCLTNPHIQLFYNSTIEVLKDWKVLYNMKAQGPVTIACGGASQTSFGARRICGFVFSLIHYKWEIKFFKKNPKIPVCIFLFRFNRHKINLQSSINVFKHLVSISILNSLQTGNAPWTTLVHGPYFEHDWIRSHMTSFFMCYL